jgi:hypothetical protein
MSSAAETTWEIDWLWSLPLIVMCVVIHVVGLMLIYRECTQCGSKAVNVEWDERVNATQVQYLWRCLNCKNEFITQGASDEKPISDAEISRRFFTSLVIE